MTDENGDFQALSPEDDAAVAALLATLPELTMPSDVVERIAGTLAAEAPLSGPVPVWAAGGADNVTVLPSAQGRERRRGAGWLTGVAASVVVLVGLVVVGTHLFPGDDGGSGGSTTAGDTANGPAAQESAGITGASLLTTSGTHYTSADLGSDVSGLVTQASTPGASLTALSTIAPSVSVSPTTSPPGQATTFTESKALIANLLGIQICLRKLDRPDQLPIVADAGSWDGKQAVVFVYHGDQPARVDVFVVEPACGDAADTDAHLLYFGAVPAP